VTIHVTLLKAFCQHKLPGLRLSHLDIILLARSCISLFSPLLLLLKNKTGEIRSQPVFIFILIRFGMKCQSAVTLTVDAIVII
jgi:hypothetical protein